MQIVFLMTRPMVEKCFSPQDLARLNGDHQLIFSNESNPKQLAAFWRKHAEAANVMVTGWQTPPLTNDMLNVAPNLQAIVHAAGSVRHLIPDAAWDRSLRIASAREALAVGVAETTLAMIIAGLKGLFPADRFTADGGWVFPANQLPHHRIREMHQSTIGIIGLSKSGLHVLRLLRHFEVKLLLTDPFISPAEAKRLDVELVELNDLMSQSDVVTLHAPALSETRHMLGTEQFSRMRDGAIFINTARGMIVDEDALVAELKTGRIWAFIDVTHPEPPASDHPFRTLPNCILTPHLAGAVANGCLRIGRSIVDQILELAEGKPMHGEFTRSQAAILA